MELTKENIIEWKKDLDELMKDLMRPNDNYSNYCTDETWLELYEGEAPQLAREDELYYSAQN